MEKILDLLKDHFYPNACHVCRVYGKNVRLERCGTCKMIAYCSKEHQIEHWPIHKDMCKIMSELQEADINYEMHDNYFDDPKESWRAARLTLMLCIQSKLGRELSGFELEMVVLPRCCAICHETDHSRLQDCTECPSASFCYNHPKGIEHDTQCQMSKLHLELHNVTLDMVPNFENILSLFYGKSTPRNMDEAIDAVESHCDLEKICTPKKLLAALVSPFLTRSYTFLYSMEKLSRPKLQKLKVHVIGTDASEMDSLRFWQYLLHHDESLEELQIVFVGPELSNTSVEVQLCDECTKNNRKMKIQTVGALYAQLTASRAFIVPDYVIGFNLEINESESQEIDTWPPSIRAVAKIGCPFFMTSRTVEGLKKDGERMNSILGKQVKSFWTGKNPFSSSQPVRDYESDELCYDNQYLTIYEALS